MAHSLLGLLRALIYLRLFLLFLSVQLVSLNVVCLTEENGVLISIGLI